MPTTPAINLIAQLKTSLRNVRTREEWAEIISEIGGLHQLTMIQYGLFMSTPASRSVSNVSAATTVNRTPSRPSRSRSSRRTNGSHLRAVKTA